MKRLWIACAILGALLALALWHSSYLKGVTEGVTDLLERAEAAAERESWDAAEALTQLARQKWEKRDAYVHITLRHGDTDQVYLGFREVLELIECRQAGEYSAANARLIAQLELLKEAEQLTIKNIL